MTEDEYAQRITYLIIGFNNQTLTNEEKQELDKWLDEDIDNVKLFDELTDNKILNVMLQHMRAERN